ncbi:hypothetical protein FACS18949_04740 [Clostridia bacterium]|nr:hypothetical protein FACS189425_08550 [Clostridia bacterium]GHV32766.1 hypothetical protein FACS18949_04740 [Clostridia bacterium]
MKNLYTVKAIAEKTWVIECKTYYYQGLMYVLEGNDRAMVIDAGFNLGDFGAAVKSVTTLPADLYITHGHLDHVGSAHQFGNCYIDPADLPVLAAHTDGEYLRRLAKEATPAWQRLLLRGAVKAMTTPPPKSRFQPMPETVDLGGRVVEVVNTPGHTAGGVCFLDRETRSLFSGDTLCDWGVLLHLEFCDTLEAYLASLRRLKALEPAYDNVYGGHHGYPVKAGAPDKYIKCAEGALNGEITLKADKQGFIAFYDDIRITLPKGFTRAKSS